MECIQLTNKQRAVLNAAARSCNLVAWPFPRQLALNPSSAGIIVRGLLRKGFLKKQPALGGDAVWKEEDGKRYTLVVTKAGLEAVGMRLEIEADHRRPEDDPTQKADNTAKQSPVPSASENQRRMPRAGTKLATLVALLERKEGATIPEMAANLDWKEHTARGVLSGMLKKKFGLVIVSEVIEGRDRTYRVARNQELDDAGRDNSTDGRVSP
jgi:hypothetical protein